MLKSRCRELAVGVCAMSLVLTAQAKPAARPAAEMDNDLMEVTVPQLQHYYAQHRYTVTQVVDWYLDRIARYNGVYRPIEQVFADEARATAAREDA